MNLPRNPSPSGERDSAQRAQGEGKSWRPATSVRVMSFVKTMRSEPTDAEERLWSRLRAGRLQGWKFRRQVPFNDQYVADFVCSKARLVVEVDGSQHAEKQGCDNQRTAFFERQNYRVVRFWNNDVLTQTEQVLEAIFAALVLPLPDRTSCASTLSPEGEG